jgi:YD repeat-containing protein
VRKKPGQLRCIACLDPDGAAGPLGRPPRSFTYDAAGQLTTFTDQLGAVTSDTYETLGRISTQTVSDPDGSGPLSDVTMSNSTSRAHLEDVCPAGRDAPQPLRHDAGQRNCTRNQRARRTANRRFAG